MTVLVLRALGLGDLLTAMPALRGLRRAFPGDRLVLAAPGWLEPVALLSGAVDDVLDTAPLAPPPLRGAALAVNLHGRGPQSTAALRATGPHHLWAFDLPGGPRYSVGGEAVGGEEHEVRRWCRLLAWHGVRCDPDDLALPRPRLALSPAGRASAVLVHPGGATAVRRWPVKCWAAVARELSRAGRPVLVTGSAAEQPLARRVAELAGLPDDAVLAGRTALLDLCALVADAALLLAADTGIGHLATAYGTPSVLLFGPVPPAEWGPPADRPAHRALWAGRCGDPRADRPDPGLLTLGIDDVLTAAARVEQAGRS